MWLSLSRADLSFHYLPNKNYSQFVYKHAYLKANTSFMILWWHNFPSKNYLQGCENLTFQPVKSNNLYNETTMFILELKQQILSQVDNLSTL